MDAGNERCALHQAMDRFRAEVVVDRAGYQAEMQRLVTPPRRDLLDGGV